MSEPLHILLVEDNEDDYEATARSFKKSHFMNPIKWCKNGQDALDYLNKQGNYSNDNQHVLPALILLDLNMPGLDGRQTLERIKKNPILKYIPVVVLTTSADSKDIEQCYQLGVSTYVQKPLNFDRLAEAVRTMKDYWFDIAILPEPKQV